MSEIIRAVLGVTAGFTFLAGAVCGVLGRLGKMERGYEYWWGLVTVSNACACALDAADGSWPWAAWDALTVVLAAKFWHDERRKRKRRSALTAIGAKSKALHDALVRRAREAAQPRPVLRPLPGGAR